MQYKWTWAWTTNSKKLHTNSCETWLSAFWRIRKKMGVWCCSTFFFLMACGILVPHQGLKLCPLQWNHSLNHWRVSVSHSVVSDSANSCPLPARLLCPWDSPGRNTGVSSHSLLQGIFPTQGFCKSGSPTLQTDSLQSEPPGNVIICILKTKKMGVWYCCVFFFFNGMWDLSFPTKVWNCPCSGSTDSTTGPAGNSLFYFERIKFF